MNNQRRKALSKIADAMRALDIGEIREALETLRDEEQEYFDAMPESFQSGDKGSQAENAINAMAEALDYLDQIAEALENAPSAVETAAE